MKTKKLIRINCFDNFTDSSKLKTSMFYNYATKNGLNNSKGIKVALFPKNPTSSVEKELNIADTGISSVQGIGYFKQYFEDSNYTAHRLVVYGDNKRVYFNQMVDDTYDLYWLYSMQLNSAPIFLPYKKDDTDAVVIASEDEVKIWQTGYSPYTIENVPIITSMCMNEGVLFCTIKNPAFKIWYCTDLDAEKIGKISSVSNFISLEDDLGYARKVITFNEDVYVFRDYGITKINYVKKDITISQIYASNSKIYENTVNVCGNNIFFMTNDGLFSFNGVKVQKHGINLIDKLSIDIAGVNASSLGDKYYVALKMNFNDDKVVLSENDCVNNVLLIVDTNDFSYEIIRGVDIKFMLPVKNEYFEKLLVLFNTGPVDKIGEIVDESKCVESNLPKFWSSDLLVEPYAMKLFTKLTVVADEGVKFTVLYDNKQMNFTTYKSGLNEFIFKIMCKEIKLEISSENESGNVENIQMEYYEY